MNPDTRKRPTCKQEKSSKQVGAFTQKLRAQAHLPARCARCTRCVRYTRYTRCARRLQILRRGYSTANRIIWQLSRSRTCARGARHLVSRRKQNKMHGLDRSLDRPFGSRSSRQLGLNASGGNPIALIAKLMRRLGRGRRRRACGLIQIGEHRIDMSA